MRPVTARIDWTARACALIRALFEHASAEVFFVFNGTAANSLSLAALARSYQGIVCHEAAHVQTDECARTGILQRRRQAAAAAGRRRQAVGGGGAAA